MGARLSSDTSESPGSTSGFMGSAASGRILGSASAGGTPTRHPGGSNGGAGISGAAPSTSSSAENQARLQRLLNRRQSHNQQTSHAPRSTHHRTHRSSAGISAMGGRQRPRSFGGESSAAGAGASHSVGAVGGATALELPTSSDSDEDPDLVAIRQLRYYIPLIRGDVRCRLCNKMVPYDDHEVHFVMCLTKPRVSYNEDVLTEDKGECAICLEDMNQGDTIARLPCLCIYHKGCIEEWFKRSHTCPEHPGD